MVDVNKLPYQVSNFSTLIDQARIYVDKTDLVAQLALGVGPVFLSRPRRFGKSTLVSTFEELFSHGLERFKGLKIEKQNLWHDKTYKVLHLDFSSFREDVEEVSFANKLFAHLKTNLDLISLDFHETTYVVSSFNDTLAHTEDNSLVLLIDEYDAPLTATMGDPKEFNNRRKILSDFFLSIKSYSAKFRFIFITGVTRYSHVSIFSGLNNLKDISFNSLYGTIVGYTQEELEFYFKDYLENAALVLNQKKKTTEYTYEKILECVKNHYDGYSFDEECSTHVYNPWSILNFLQEPYREFKSYWLDTGGAKPLLLVNYFTQVLDKKIDKSELLNYLKENVEVLANTDSLSPAIESIEQSDFPFEAILYQAGYFTIKRINSRGQMYIGIPNSEVHEAFEKILLEKLINKTELKLSEDHDTLAESAIEEKNISDFLGLLNALLNEFSYETVPTFKEAHFREIYKVTLRCMGFKTFAEDQLSSGRTDLEIYAQKYLYVIEFKIVDDNNEALIDKALNEAKTQMISRKYTVRLANFFNLKTVGLACVIVNQNKDEKHDKPFREVVRLEEVGSVNLEVKKN